MNIIADADVDTLGRCYLTRNNCQGDFSAASSWTECCISIGGESYGSNSGTINCMPW